MSHYIKITRPHKKPGPKGWTGLDGKKLGRLEYARQWHLKRIEVGLDPKPSYRKPRWTGLSEKILGVNQYQRIRNRMIGKIKGTRNWWTGLTTKGVTPADYMREYRKLRKQKARELLAGDDGQ